MREFDIVFDVGAYADNSPLELEKAVNRCFGPYRVPNLQVSGRAVYTNTAPACSYRGFGAYQGAFAGETNLDQAAQILGIDPAELRRRNLVARGETLVPDARAMDADLVADLDLLEARLRRSSTDRSTTGVGFACSASDAGASATSVVEVKMLADESVLVIAGATEMGQGSHTVLARIASLELQVPAFRVHVLPADTAVAGFEPTTGASRTTTVTGLAVQRACQDVLRLARSAAADIWDWIHHHCDAIAAVSVTQMVARSPMPRLFMQRSAPRVAS